MIEIELPDGTIAEFPEGTPNDAIKGALQKRFGAPKASNPAPVDASTVFTDDMLFGLPGKASAGINALAQRGIAALPGESPFEGKTVSELYDQNRQNYTAGREKYAEESPVANTAASLAGGVYGGAVTGGLALKGAQALAPNLVGRLGSSFAGKMAGDAALGAVQGAATAYGNDQDMASGALIGGATGGLARPVIAAGGAALNSIGGLVGVGNAGRAKDAIYQALTRSGKSANSVVDDIARAAADGQDVYTVADALGNSGQRMLTGIVRSPGDERAAVIEALQRRQAGQGRRLQNALTEGFGAPQTQRQTEEALKALRSSEANVNYSAARQSAGAVDPTGAISKADEFLGTGGSLPLTDIAGDSVAGTVQRAKSMLTDGSNVISDFDTAFRTKIELDSMIEKANPTVQRQLIPIRNELDKAIEKSSAPYAQARDTFRQQSENLSAVDIGRKAAMSGRVEDTLDTFGKMARPEQQQAFRSGYVDPYIADIQKTAGSMTNRARPLITDATQAEFPAFAQPGKSQQMMDRIGREQTMFETASQALGGSKTAENLADMMDAQSFDPSMIGALASGNLKGAALQGLTKAVQSVQGRNSQTRDLIAKALMSSSPQKAREVLDAAVKKGQVSADLRTMIVRGLTGGTNALYATAN